MLHIASGGNLFILRTKAFVLPRKWGKDMGFSRHVRYGFASAFIFCLLAAALAIHLTAQGGVALTEEELEFIKSHPVIRIGVDPGFVPFEFIGEDGEYKGIAADYVKIIGERTGLRFELVQAGTWPEVYELALAGEVDVLPAVGKTPHREERFLFSEPYYYFKRVIATRDDERDILGIEDLYGQTVAVQRHSSHHSYLLTLPKINLSLYETVEVALVAVATGAEKAYLGNLATTSYIIRTHGLTNLRLISFEAEKHEALHFAVRKDMPELAGIINKALASVTESEKRAIVDRWVELDTEIDYRPVIRVALMVGGLLAAILAVSFFWIAKLRGEIKRRKEVQLELEAAKKEAEEANEVKSRFLARMSHEIRTPLVAITGMAYLLKKTEVSLTQRMYVDRIIQAANSMLSIINDILDFSKIEAGKLGLENTSFSMDQVIHDVVNVILYKVDEQGLGLKLTKDPLLPSWFYGDPKRIEQILLNLLSNAVKFTESGEVSLDIRLLAKENEKYHISFAISDTGIGMTEEQVGKLFVPFEQGDSSISRRYGGSGLGLSIVKSLVDMMGGEIKVYSTPGEGTTFIINLVLLADAEKESAYKKALTARQTKSLRALILKKPGAGISLIESYLKNFGMYCERASSEESAVCALEAAGGKPDAFDLFIIDYETPEGGGFRFVERLRNNDKIVKLPKTLMLFPMMRYDLFEKLGDYGIDLGIGKPIIPSVLLDGILDIFNLKADYEPHPEPEKGKLTGGYLVLLAEDNKTNQLIAKTLLEQVGIGVLVAADGKEAVELFLVRKSEIDLVLMDLHMPVLSGYEAAERIRARAPDVPIVAMTADAVSGVQERCKKSGICHYISKPFDPDSFIETVVGLLPERKPQKPSSAPLLDRCAGLDNMGGSEGLYYSVLATYYGENRDTPERLSDAIRNGRYADAAQILHKLKSGSGSIGAKVVQKEAELLQKALSEGDEAEVMALHGKFIENFKKLLYEIAQTVDKKPSE